MAKGSMARSSPGVLRIAAILNFIADHPGQGFTLTDIVKALKLSRATCHALLTGLVEVGYLFRATDKVYVLGPTLASIGRIAAEHASPLQVAQPDMRSLADEFDAVCACFFRERDDIVVRDRAASASHVGWSIPLGTRLRLRPPFGAVFYAWGPEADALAWLDSAVPPPSPEHRAAMMGGMVFAREHGFQVNIRTSNAAMIEQPVEQVFGEESIDFPVSVLQELREDDIYRVAGLVAPVFTSSGMVAFAMGLTGFNGTMRGRDILRVGGRLREACDRVTKFIVGRAHGSFIIRKKGGQS